ncbi:MAG: 16S rRNA (guanine(527)-N(7))-methyltransferase RsmG [Mogibacterium sp.]|nr:16S rRNA (guanine(527)-N(7))-methyltransferase RsmG [Mogibacterium sp.]
MDRLAAKIGAERAEILCRYMDAILERNQQINLTAIRDREEFILKHLLDSLSLMDLPEIREARRIVDVGTGAGFPGIPLAVAYPEKQILLIDSLSKKLRVVSEIAGSLGITNAQTLHIRAEDAGRDPVIRDRYDICVSRAVASMDVLAEWCLPLVRKEGCFIAMKGGKTEDELEAGKAAIRALNGKIDRVVSVALDADSAEEHTLIVIRKTAGTPRKYPRKAGVARKEPIR